MCEFISTSTLCGFLQIIKLKRFQRTVILLLGGWSKTKRKNELFSPTTTSHLDNEEKQECTTRREKKESEKKKTKGKKADIETVYVQNAVYVQKRGK
jgi:hypothetical protein